MVFLVGSLAYAILYYAWPLPSLTQLSGRPWRRWQFFEYLLVPEVLVQRWFDDASASALLDRLPIVACAGAILVAAWAAGLFVLRATGGERHLEALERFVVQLAVGLSAVSLYTLAVGLAGALRSRSLFALPGILLIAAAMAARSGRRRRQVALKRRVSGESPWRGGWLWLTIPFAILIVLGGMLPPVEFDVREYHLQAPKEFYLRGRVGFMPHNVYANMPLGSEMHALLGMVLLDDWWRGALVGKTIQSLFVPLTALLLLAAGRRWFSADSGALAALIYLSTPWVALVATNGLVEGAVAFYLLASVYALLLWRDSRKPPLQQVRQTPSNKTESPDPPGKFGRLGGNALLLLSGFLAGSAVAIKYPAVVFVLLPLGAAVAIVSRPRSARPLLAFWCAAATACGPWFVKNWMLTGNPTYPLLYSVLDGQTRTAAKNAQWQRAHDPPNFAVADLARRAVDITVGSPWQSPLVMPLVVAALAAVRRRPSGLLFAYCLYVLAAWWLLTHRIDRFWLPALPVACLVGGASRLWAWSRARRLAIGILVGVGITYSAILLAGGVLGYNRYFASLDRLRVDPDRVGPAQLWLNTHAPKGKAVLVVGDAQVFDLEMPVLYNTVFDDCVFEQLVCDSQGQLRPAAQIRRRLAGVAYVYVNWQEIQRYRSPGNYGFSDLVQPSLFQKLVAAGVLAPPVKQFAGGAAQIYPVRPE